MTGRIKQANKNRELEELAFSVLLSFRHQGAMQWMDWYETTSARRGNTGLGTTTFSDTVKRLVAKGQVQIDGDGCYQAVNGGMGDVCAMDGVEGVVSSPLKITPLSNLNNLRECF